MNNKEALVKTHKKIEKLQTLKQNQETAIMAEEKLNTLSKTFSKETFILDADTRILATTAVSDDANKVKDLINKSKSWKDFKKATKKQGLRSPFLYVFPTPIRKASKSPENIFSVAVRGFVSNK